MLSRFGQGRADPVLRNHDAVVPAWAIVEAWRDQSAGASPANGRADRPRPPGTAAGAGTAETSRSGELPPELLNAPHPDDDADTGHNHGLMAAFRRGCAVAGRKPDGRAVARLIEQQKLKRSVIERRLSEPGSGSCLVLKGLAQEVPVIRGSVLLSSDGMMKAPHGWTAPTQNISRHSPPTLFHGTERR